MKILTTSLLLALLPLVACAAEKPNIVLIMADDMGFSDIGPYGGEIETPTLDALAKGGMKFSNFYNSGRCCPTRASLMTGLHPHQTGIGHMTDSSLTPNRKSETDLPGYLGHLNRNCATLGEVLKGAGYATFITGKWHLGMSDPELYPLQRGFENFYGILKGAGPYFDPTSSGGIVSGNEINTIAKSTTDRRFYTTDAFTDHAIGFIDEEKKSKDRPFFLYLAYTAPHWPLHAHQEEIDKYVGKYAKGWDALREERLKRQRASGLIESDWALSERSFKAWDSLTAEQQKDLDKRMAIYAAMIDRMDQNIGNLVSHLKENDQFDNTLILFLSDNGACQEGGKLGGKGDPFNMEEWNKFGKSEASYGEAWANAGNTPFRKFKHFTHEGGISTPFIAHWPKGIKANAEWYRERAYLPDIAPTLYQLAEATYPESLHGNKMPPLTGSSLVPAFDAKSITRAEPMYFEHENNAAIIIGNMKLVGSGVSAPNGVQEEKWELYNLKKDRTELHDLAKTQPEQVATMSAKWSSWAKSANVYPKPPARRSAKRAKPKKPKK